MALENELLRERELAARAAAVTSTRQTVEMEGELDRLRRQLTEEKARNATLASEKVELEHQLNLVPTPQDVDEEEDDTEWAPPGQ